MKKLPVTVLSGFLGAGKTPDYIELRGKLLHLLTEEFSIEDMGVVYQE